MLCVEILAWFIGFLLGHSVCCNVHGFEPYFYISCPPGMGPDDISHFHKILEVFNHTTFRAYIYLLINLCISIMIFFMILKGRMREVNRNSKVPKFVRRIELVQKRSIMYYQQQTSSSFLKIVVALPTMVTSCRGKCFIHLKHTSFSSSSFFHGNY